MASAGSLTNEDFIFQAKLDSVGTIATLLKSVAFTDRVNVFISDNGMKFTVEEGKNVQAYVLMHKQVFQEFELTVDEAAFRIPLKELLEFLKIFCSDGKGIDMSMNLANTSIKLKYAKYGSPFEILLDENGIQTEIRLKTEDVEDLMEIEIDPVDCKIGLNGAGFYEVIQEIDRVGMETVNIEILAGPKDILFSGHTSTGSVLATFSSTSSVIEYFECGQVESAASYRLASLKYAFRAMQIVDKFILKMNREGVLSLSFLLTQSDSFVEFLFIPTLVNDEPVGVD
ncbi:uncharacterized protein LOC110851236 [Folsomia candida]|uniref:Cell cycle checkpoint protein RAD1 n=1 Tax=Folsomia candida TaxID=158441 RepID=A0A226E4J4_FOLCA|nr:uncharacterized protein LOC110851236 [Folsomia candida]OXA52662.1 Cell cycle checkpoint protein RAD1 [Folsomia candida]